MNFSAFPDQDEIFIKCYIKSNWGITPVIEAYISNVVVATDRTNDNGTQTNNKSAWKQIPLLVRIVYLDFCYWISMAIHCRIFLGNVHWALINLFTLRLEIGGGNFLENLEKITK